MADAIRSPFPGMDPWMEQSWGDVHTSLTTYARDVLNGDVPQDLIASAEERVYVGEGREVRRPDVSVLIRPAGRRLPGDPGGATAVLAAPRELEPHEFILPEDDITEPYIEIRDRNGNRVVTVIEFVSPSNKADGRGWELYHTKREQLLVSDTNLVEIDLCRYGGVAARERLWHPVRLRPPLDTTYAACVYRVARAGRVTVYPMPLSRPLPPLPIPLRASDADVMLPLQQLVDQVYRNGRYDTTDYTRPPPEPLDPREAAVAGEYLDARPDGPASA